jgi:hypothetical protein
LLLGVHAAGPDATLTCACTVAMLFARGVT